MAGQKEGKLAALLAVLSADSTVVLTAVLMDDVMAARMVDDLVAPSADVTEIEWDMS